MTAVKLEKFYIRANDALRNQELRACGSSRLNTGLEGEISSSIKRIGTFLLELQDALLALDWDALFGRINQILAGIPYEIFPRQEATMPEAPKPVRCCFKGKTGAFYGQDTYVHSLIHLMLVSTDLRVQSQVQTSLGRIDTVIETPDQFVILEFKIGGTAQLALDQIIDKEYAASFSSKPVIGVGVVFDLESKSIAVWESLKLS
jgi:hypothetical protein